MIRHYRALKALLDVVGEELFGSDEDDQNLRISIGELSIKLKEKIESIERGDHE